MVRVKSVVLALVAALVCGGFLSGDDKKSTKGYLPQNWRKLGLSDDQKQKIYSIQGEYREKIADLRKQMVALQKKQMSEMEAVLTPAQKTRLREIISEKLPKETAPKDKIAPKDKAAPEKKTGDKN